jgi:predicted nucleic acid-binding protein
MGTLTTLDDTLKRMRGKRVYFDTAPIIYALENAPDFAECSIPFLRASGDRDFVGYTGVATLAEMLVRPLRNKNRDYAEHIKTLFLSGDVFQCSDHSTDVFLLTASLRADDHYKAIDALHLATAMTLGCQFFVTNDEAFKSTATTEVVLVSRFSDKPEINRLPRGRA